MSAKAIPCSQCMTASMDRQSRNSWGVPRYRSCKSALLFGDPAQSESNEFVVYPGEGTTKPGLELYVTRICTTSAASLGCCKVA